MNSILSKVVSDASKFRCKVAAALAIGSGIGAAAGCGFIGMYSGIGIGILMALLFRERRSCLALLTGIILTWISGLNCRNDELLRYAAYPADGVVQGRIVITDSRASRVPGARVEKRIKADFTGEGKSTTVPVLLSFEANRNGSSLPLLYGDTMRVSGILNCPDSSGCRLLENGALQELTPPYGEAYLLRVTGYSFSAPERNLRRFCFELREHLLRFLLDGMPDTELRAMAARLFFGASAGAPTELKKKFALAGIIHIFAVSGMHVGVAALLSCWLFRWLPLRRRMILTAVLTAGYVMCSGMAVPAVRAGTMIITWTLLRGFLLFIPSLDILMFSFFALMLVDPLAVSELGVQYSYGITAALIVGLNSVRQCRDQFMLGMMLMPSGSDMVRKMAAAGKFRFRVFQSLSAVIIAFCAGAMLTVWRMNIFNPGSIAANILITLTMPLLFAAMAIKMAGAAVGGLLNGFGTWLLEMFFRILEYVSELVQELFGVWPVKTPPVSVVVIFYLLFAGALICRRAVVKWILFSLSVIMLAAMPLLSRLQPEEIMVISGDCGRPALIALLGQDERRALVCDLPDSWSGILAADELKRCGYDEAEVCFSGGYSGNNAGLAAFASRIKVRRIILPDKQHYYFRKHLSEFAGSENCEMVNIPAGKLKRFGRGNDAGIFWQMNGRYAIEVIPAPDGRRVKVFKNGAFHAGKTLPWSNHHILWRSGLKKMTKSPE